MLRHVVLAVRLGIPLAILAVPQIAAGQDRATAPAGFLDVRYATRTSLTLYGGYQVGTTMLLVGMVQNPRTDYREAVAGVARTVGGARWASATVAVAGSYASDGWYAQLYVLPTLTRGRFTVSGLLQAYEPLEDEGARQFYANPLSLFVSPVKDVRVGTSYTLATQAGLLPQHRVGPAVQVVTRAGTATVTTLAGLGQTRGEFRLGFNAPL